MSLLSMLLTPCWDHAN